MRHDTAPFWPADATDAAAKLLARLAPAALRPAIHQFQRDVGTLLRGFSGQRPPPVRVRAVTAPTPTPTPTPLPAAAPRVVAPTSAALLEEPPKREARGPSPQRVTYRIAGTARVLTVAPGQTLLEAGLDAGLPMPFSCTLGGCGACRVHLREGAVEMQEPTCLSPAERAEGYVLACVGCPTEDCVIEVPT